METSAPSTLSPSSTPPAKTRKAKTEASHVPASVPHFKSFDHISDPRVRRAKEYEQYLLFSREQFPEFATRINGEIKWARTEQERSKPSDRELIHSALQGSGGLLCNEVAEDTGLPYSTVYKHLREMLDEGLVSATSRPGLSANKPMLVWSLAH